jgi:PleD family two-component response regulator
VPVTVSVGVATWAQEPAEELLRRADGALYRAKQGGRDRVMAATLHGRT